MIVATCGSPWTEAVLAAGLTATKTPLASLSSAVLWFATAAAASLLAFCGNLTSCSFVGLECELDLGCLHALPKLDSLRVDNTRSCGPVLGLGSLAHLTNLELKLAEVDCSGSALFTSTLRSLSTNMGIIFNLHSLGISACSELQILDFDESCIQAGEAEHTLEATDEETLLPGSLSALKQLTELSFNFWGPDQGSANFSWLAELTSLVSVRLYFARAPVQHKLTSDLTALNQLQHLAVILNSEQGCMLTLDIAWHRMQSLLTARFCAGSLMCDDKILGFARLQSLPANYV